jgi:hypothetical protein
MRTQSSLGNLKKFNRTDIAMEGFLSIGKVIKVNHKWHTANVEVIDTGDIIVGSDETEGKYSCRILENFAGSGVHGVYGSITPIAVGDYVLVGWLRARKAQPVILGCFHSLNTEKNPLPKQYPVTEDDEKYGHTAITYTQDFRYVSGKGEFELSHHSKAFVVGSERYLNDETDGFDYKDLHVKDPYTDDTIGTDEKHFTPLDILAVIRNKFAEGGSYLKMLLSGKDNMMRLTQYREDEPEKLMYMELDTEGMYKFRRQLDSNVHGEAKEYTEITVDSFGNVTIGYFNNEKNMHTLMSINTESNTYSVSRLDEDGNTMDFGLSKEDVSLSHVRKKEKTSMSFAMTKNSISLSKQDKEDSAAISIAEDDSMSLSTTQNFGAQAKENLSISAKNIMLQAEENISLAAAQNINLGAGDKVIATPELHTPELHADIIYAGAIVCGGTIIEAGLQEGGFDVNDPNPQDALGGVTLEEFMKNSQYAPGSWLYCVETVKAMLAAQGLEYSQATTTTYDFGGFKTTVHPDCSGTVTAMLSLYTGQPMSQLSSYNFVSRSSLPGFTKQAWSGWDNLRTGDIIARNGHVEVFAYRENGVNYVWNAGSTGSVQSAKPTRSGHSSYSTVWRAT